MYLDKRLEYEEKLFNHKLHSVTVVLLSINTHQQLRAGHGLSYRSSELKITQ